MWKRELLKNKLYALLLVGLSLPIMFLDGDATATVLMLFFAVPMFFAKENWIMGGTYATQESRRKSVRRCTYRSGEKSDGFRDPAGTGRVRQKTHRRYEMEDQDDIWLCTQMLKRIGVDIEAWHKESDYGT